MPTETEPLVYESILERDGVRVSELRRGDIVMVRTGRMNVWPGFDGYTQNQPGVGLGAAKYMCEEIGVMFMGTDTLSFEPVPSAEPDAFLRCVTDLFASY